MSTSSPSPTPTTPTTLLAPWSRDVWTIAAPQTMLGLHLGTRMTVVRLPGGGLLLHSPVPLSSSLRREIDALGEVTHLVAPNLYHHLHVGPWVEAYPNALLHAPRALAKKRADLRVHAELGAAPHPDWQGALVPLAIDGSMLAETVFVHPTSRTLISADLAENFATSDHFATRLYLKVGGVHGKVGWNRLLRFIYRDRAAARRSIDALLEHEFDRMVLAHGSPIEHAAKDAVRSTFAFL